MRLERSSIRNVRLDSMLDAIAAGNADSEYLLKVAGMAEARASRARGKDTDKRFLRYLRVLHIVEYARQSTLEEEARGIDYWLTFRADTNIPNLPIQIKSSDEYVSRFKSEKAYKKLDGLIIVVNVGPKVSRTTFRKAFSKELKRVTRKLRQT